MSRSKSKNLFQAALMAGTALAIVPEAATAQDTEQHAESHVEEIIVTAQKREQSLQDVPISITALTESVIEANRIQDVRDLSSIAPNLTVRPSNGGPQIPNYSMRGIVTGGAAIGTDKGVALYLDGVYIQNALGSVFQVADVQRIEVLKGPQGTLFGRNATGGAVSIVTRNPTGEFAVRQELSYGNFNQFRSKTRIDLPKLGPISAAVTYLHSERKGDTRNLGAGTTWDYGPATSGKVGKVRSPDTLGDENVEGVLAALTFDFHPDLELSYKFDYSENHYTPEAVGASYLQPGSIIAQLYAQQAPALRTPITTKRPDAVNNSFTIPGFSKSWGHNLTARYQLTDSLSVKNILSFRGSNLFVASDFSGIGGLQNLPVTIPGLGTVPPAWLPGGNPGQRCLAPGAAATPLCALSIGKPFTFIASNAFNDENQWSNEFQVNFNSDLVTITAGLLHFHDDQKTGGIAGAFNSSTLMAFYGQNTSQLGTPYVIPANIGYQNSTVSVNSDAAYIQPEFHVTDKIDLIGGLRYTRDRKTGTQYFPGTANLVALGLPITSPIDYKDDRFTYLVGVNYRPTTDIMLYAKYSTGYISGGDLATIKFAPETAESIEGGIKTTMANGRVRSNLAVFHAKYEKIQVNTSGSLTGQPSALAFGVAIVPAADATAYGFEWENTIVPVDGLTLNANIGYLHFKFDQSTVFPGFANQSGVPGYLENVRPKWSGNVSAQYETGEVLAGGRLVFRVDGNFESQSLLTTDVTPLNANDPSRPLYNPNAATVPFAAVVEDPLLRKGATADAKLILNARVALADFEFGGTTATAALWGRNLLDQDSAVQFSGLGQVGPIIYERERTYGVEFTFSF